MSNFGDFMYHAAPWPCKNPVYNQPPTRSKATPLNVSVEKPKTEKKSQAYWRAQQGKCHLDPTCLKNDNHSGSCTLFRENRSRTNRYVSNWVNKKSRKFGYGGYAMDPDQDEFYGHSGGGGGVDFGDGPYY